VCEKERENNPRSTTLNRPPRPHPNRDHAQPPHERGDDGELDVERGRAAGRLDGREERAELVGERRKDGRVAAALELVLDLGAPRAQLGQVVLGLCLVQVVQGALSGAQVVVDLLWCVECVM
jgi:hypothetical protein